MVIAAMSVIINGIVGNAAGANSKIGVRNLYKSSMLVAVWIIILSDIFSFVFEDVLISLVSTNDEMKYETKAIFRIYVYFYFNFSVIEKIVSLVLSALEN